MKTYFESIEINGKEENLPKEDEKYYFHVIGDFTLRFCSPQSATFRQIKKHIDWYLLPVSLPGRENLKKELIIKITMNVIEDYYKNESKGWTTSELDNLRVEWYDIGSGIADELEGKGGDLWRDKKESDEIHVTQSESKVSKTVEEMLKGLPIMYGAKDGINGKTLLIKTVKEYTSQFAQQMPRNLSDFDTITNNKVTLPTIQQMPEIIEIEKQLLNRFGFIDDGVDAENQLKIFSFMDWYKKRMGEKKGVDKDTDHAIAGR